MKHNVNLSILADCMPYFGLMVLMLLGGNLLISACAPDHTEAHEAKGGALHADEQSLMPLSGVTIADDFPDYTSAECMRLCDSLYADGVRWVAVTPCGVMRSVHSTEVIWTNWSRRDYRKAIRMIRARGLKVLLKPYIWSNEFYTKQYWTGDVELPSAEARARWFRSYTDFMLDNARFAQEGGAEALCIGLELPKMSPFETEWRALIAELRPVYKGLLTYASHGHEEAANIRFWDDLDFIGVNVYPSLSESHKPSDEELRAGWEPFLRQYAELYERNGKKIVFTETGFRSVVAATYKPWEWPEHTERPANLEQQEQAYRILAEQTYQQPWFAGLFWWKVYTNMNAGGAGNSDFTPQNKPAYRQMVDDFQVLNERFGSGRLD